MRTTLAPSAIRRVAVVALAVACFVVVADRQAAAGMYTWVDDQGDRHLVDSREKVPPRYRSRAKEVSPDDSRAPTPPGRDPQAGAEPRPTKSAGQRDRNEIRRDDARADPRASESSWGWLDRARAKWVTGLPTFSWIGERRPRWLTPEQAIRFAAVVLSAAVLARVLAAIEALRAARGLAAFGTTYRAHLTRRDGRIEPALLERLELELPRVHRWCRRARLGVTTIGASREVGMGRVMDEGRVDVLSASLTRTALVGQHTLALLSRAEGVHRHRARRALSLLGGLEVLAYWPQYVVWRSSEDPRGGVRVLLSLYWLAVLGWAVFG